MMVELIQMSGLAAGTAVAGHARVVASDLARTRTEALYQRFELADPSGVQVVARRFGCGSPPPPAGCVVYVQGVVEEYRGQTTLKLHACREDPVVPAALFFPWVPHTRRATLADLDALVGGIEDAALRALVRACFGPAVRERFAVAPAGVRHHGAAVGGLLAHTVRVARTALALTELVPHVVDRDVVVSAALLHDLGKVDELVPDPGAGLTDPGRLLGHVLLGAVAVLRANRGAGVATGPRRGRAPRHRRRPRSGRVWSAGSASDDRGAGPPPRRRCRGDPRRGPGRGRARGAGGRLDSVSPQVPRVAPRPDRRARHSGGRRAVG